MSNNGNERVQGLLDKVAAIIRTRKVTQRAFSREIGVMDQQTNQWLTRIKTPGGEYTLQLQEWVNLQLNSIMRKPSDRRAYETHLKEIQKERNEAA